MVRLTAVALVCSIDWFQVELGDDKALGCLPGQLSETYARSWASWPCQATMTCLPIYADFTLGVLTKSISMHTRGSSADARYRVPTSPHKEKMTNQARQKEAGSPGSPAHKPTDQRTGRRRHPNQLERCPMTGAESSKAVTAMAGHPCGSLAASWRH
ncbi:hypothetical protein DER45DRAFT_628426 [Fusarium avenaceum]|nr:hypothetical protein DER45DRAFT_628426 [Fusarium avenaceum]